MTHVFDNAGYETHFEVGPKHSATLLQQLRRSLAGGVGSGPGESRRLMPLAAKVTDNKDPSGRVRVRVSFHQFSENNQGPWARVATLAAGAGSGTVFLPEVGDDVLVAFEQGDIDRPIVLGGLWDGQKKPPETNADGKNNVQMIKTKAGHLIKFDNTEGTETVLIDKPREARSRWPPVAMRGHDRQHESDDRLRGRVAAPGARHKARYGTPEVLHGVHDISDAVLAHTHIGNMSGADRSAGVAGAAGRASLMEQCTFHKAQP